MMPPKIVGKTDEVYTPEIAIFPLLPYLKKEWKIFECACGTGELLRHLQKWGYLAFGDPKIDFLKTGRIECDCIVTNPPYSLKTRFITRCFQYEKPFALLLPITALEGQERSKMYQKYDIQVIIPNKRINFEMTEPVRKSAAWFQAIWITYGLELPKQLNFVELSKPISASWQGEHE